MGFDVGEVDVSEGDGAGRTMGFDVLFTEPGRISVAEPACADEVMTGASSLPVIVIVTGWVDVAPKLSVTVTL